MNRFFRSLPSSNHLDMPLRAPAVLLGLLLVATTCLHGQASRAFVVAHRGASFYAPEHTLPAYRLALEQGAEYVEQDLVITKDGVLICLHDPSLERTTDVEAVFPDRFTDVVVDGQTVRRWYPEDFTLAEIKRLDAGAWFDARFAGERIPTFQEAIDLIRGRAGFFPELKNPGRLRAKGIDLERAVTEVLTTNGLVGAMLHGRPAVHMQVFEEESVRRLAALLPAVPRSFLIGTPAHARQWLSDDGLDEVKAFATGVAPARQLIDADPAIVRRAQARGLTVVPYTFRLRGRPAPAAQTAALPEAARARLAAYEESLPPTRDALTRQMRAFVVDHGVDGLFTDNPDLFPR
jgi:glycerophosphoryl diester phosphodiesterase